MARRRRTLLPDFIATTLWMIPALAVVMAGGFFLGRDIVGPKYLTPTQIRDNRPRPIRILTPEEAEALVRQNQVDAETAAKVDKAGQADQQTERPRRRTRRNTETPPAPERATPAAAPTTPTGNAAPSPETTTPAPPTPVEETPAPETTPEAPAADVPEAQD